MNQIVWNDSYSVNNAEIDAQHKEWIVIYNRLDHTMRTGNSSALHTSTADTLEAMKKYTEYHFRKEEEYMKEINYPDLVAHKRKHTDFDDELYNYNKMVRSGELVLNTEVMSIIKKWLLHHILHEDQKYASMPKSL